MKILEQIADALSDIETSVFAAVLVGALTVALAVLAIGATAALTALLLGYYQAY